MRGNIRNKELVIIIFKECRICIDAGHGGKDPGACSGEFKEKDLTLDIALSLKKRLSRYKNFKVFMTREKDESLSLSYRCEIANKNLCQLFVSIHINSAPNYGASGIETYVYGDGDKSNGLLFQERLIATTGEKDRGVKTNPLLYVLGSTNMTAVLLELGFINNFHDINNLRKATYRQKLANAIESAICKYFDIPVKGDGTKMIYQSVNQIPEYANDTIRELVNDKIIKGDTKGDLNLSEEMVRTIIICKRMIDKKIKSSE